MGKKRETRLIKESLNFYYAMAIQTARMLLLDGRDEEYAISQALTMYPELTPEQMVDLENHINTKGARL